MSVGCTRGSSGATRVSTRQSYGRRDGQEPFTFFGYAFWLGRAQWMDGMQFGLLSPALSRGRSAEDPRRGAVLAVAPACAGDPGGNARWINPKICGSLPDY